HDMVWSDYWRGLIIADTGNHALRIVYANGTMGTLAGNGTVGGSFGYVPASAARFNLPQGVALGPDNIVYIADTGNKFLRTLYPDGSVEAYIQAIDELTDVCMNIMFVYGVSQNAERAWWLLTIRPWSDHVRNGLHFGDPADDDCANTAICSLRRPHGIDLNTVESAILTIADTGNNRVIEANLQTESGRSFTGTISPDGSFSSPEHAARNPALKYTWVADTMNNKMRLIQGTNTRNMLNTLLKPAGFALDGGLSIWITSAGTHTVYYWYYSIQLYHVAGVPSLQGGYNGDCAAAHTCLLNTPLAVALASRTAQPDAVIFIVDSLNHRVRAYYFNGSLLTVAGSG
ncbi:MAG: hypothetical protein EOO65_06125, partial [Methanosarcinales archaeon]